MIIRLKVFEQTLSIVDTKSVLRKGSKDYLALQFLFSSDWKDLNKVCYLQHGEVSQPIDVVDNLVDVPEWFTQQDSFDVTLFGKGGSQEVPTNVVSLRLEKSNTLWEQDAPEPQPSWLAKVIDLNNHPPVPGENGYWLLWDTDSGAYVESELPLPAGGSGGTSDHSMLINRDNADQHPMSAVTGLVEALDGKQPKGDYLTRDDLQSATNAALEQAKASGEFDGTDGTTPHIGDNGNWYLGDTDTGKTSRGETGAGMDITGATVGQITKITAVDDSGKPTAWEAVDMPSGGGVSDYTELTNKPKINGVELSGDKTSADYGIGNPTDEQVASSVETWLDAHPEATTTVADGSINPDKTTWMRQVWHNIFNPDDGDLQDGYYFFTTANAMTTGGGTAEYFTSGYIPVLGGKQYYFNAPTAHVKIFDVGKAYISTVTTSGGNIIEIPDGAVYMRFSIHKGKVTADAAQVYEYMGEVWEYDTYKNLYSIVVTDAGYSKAIADMIEGKFVDGSLAPADLFADESILYKQMKGWDEFHWNLVDADKLEEGTINNTTGADAPTPNAFIHRRTPYMPVTPGETLFWLWSYVYGYDAGKNFVSKITQETNGSGVVPDGVYFIRATRYGNVEPTINIYRRGYGQNELKYDSEYPYSHGFPVFKDEDSKEGFKCYLGIHPWADKKFAFIGDSFTAPGTWCSVMCDNLKAVYHSKHAVSGGAFSDYDGVPKTAYEQAQEMVTNGATPDAILVTLGTNDASNSRTIGDIVQSNSISDFDLTTYTGGMQACLNYLQNNFPDAIIYVGWTPMGGLSAANAEYITRMQEVCLIYGVEYIETRTCGVTTLSDVYAECYEGGTNGGHPTGVGQQKIGAYMTRLMQSKM